MPSLESHRSRELEPVDQRAGRGQGPAVDHLGAREPNGFANTNSDDFINSNSNFGAKSKPNSISDTDSPNAKSKWSLANSFN